MQLSNLIEAVSTGMITIVSVRSECKVSSDRTERTEITPKKFMESIEYLNETMFKSAVDLYFEFPDTKTVLIKCGMHNQFMDEYFFADCKINDGVTMDEVEKKLRQSIFDKLAG